jgi:hypothetical protein
MISAETLAFLRGSQAVVTRKATTPFLSAFTTNADGETTATADAFLHVEGGTYNALVKGVVVGQVEMLRKDHGALKAATGLPVHDALDWSRMPGLALMHVGAENAMAGKTWLERPPVAQVALADLSTGDWADKSKEDVKHDLGVLEKARRVAAQAFIEGHAQAIPMDILVGTQPSGVGDGGDFTVITKARAGGSPAPFSWSERPVFKGGPDDAQT